MTKRGWDSTDSQTLIERFDNKNSTHITAFVAIIFGAFTLLTFIQGKGFPPSEPSVVYLTIMEIVVFPLGIFYCLCKSFHYSMCVEKVKAHSELLHMENEVSDESLKALPYIANKLVSARNNTRTRKIIFLIIPLVYMLWFGVVVAVLLLPVTS